jgi:acetyl-CoA carboxylase/biotin carboxylase 1
MRAHQRAERRWLAFAADIGAGRATLQSHALAVEDEIELIYAGVKFSLVVRRTGPFALLAALSDDAKRVVPCELRALSDGGALVLLDGHKFTCYGQEEATGLRLMVDGRTYVFVDESDPSQLRTATPGKLARWLVENGDHVKAGQPYAEMEVMKMFLPLIARESGRIQFQKTEGASLAAGGVVATLELDDASAVRRATPFAGQLPAVAAPHALGSKPCQVLRRCLDSIGNVLNGYEADSPRAEVDRLFSALDDPLLPITEFNEALAALSGRVSKQLVDDAHRELDAYNAAVRKTVCEFADCAEALRKLVTRECERDDCDEKQRLATRATVAPLFDLCVRFVLLCEYISERSSITNSLVFAHSYAEGRRGRMRRVVAGVLARYIAVEQRFEKRSAEDVLYEVREQYKDEPKRVFEIAL